MHSECTRNNALRFLECTWNALAFFGMHLERILEMRLEFKKYKQKNSSYIISFVKNQSSARLK